MCTIKTSLIKSLIEIQNMGLVSDLADKISVTKMLFRRGETALGIAVSSMDTKQYATILHEMGYKLMDKDVNSTIAGMAEKMGATLMGSMSLRDIMEFMDISKELKKGFTQVQASKSSMGLSDAFVGFLEVASTSVTEEIEVCESALSKIPKVKASDMEGKETERTVFEMWDDYKKALDAKEQMTQLVNMTFILPEDKVKYLAYLNNIESSISGIDFYLDHCTLALAEMND